MEEEPLVAPEATALTGSTDALRADFSVLTGTNRVYYDVQIVALNKDSARNDPYETLEEAYREKQLKYRVLGQAFKPLIFSAGGLMSRDTAQSYKSLQRLIGPQSAKWLDKSIALILTQARATAASSIARVAPRA